MRDVAFYFRKKTGFPKITDSGLADVVLGGQGLTAVIHLVSADKDKRCVLFSLVLLLLSFLFYSEPFIISILASSTSSMPSHRTLLCVLQLSFRHKTPRTLYEAKSSFLVRLRLLFYLSFN